VILPKSHMMLGQFEELPFWIRKIWGCLVEAPPDLLPISCSEICEVVNIQGARMPSGTAAAYLFKMTKLGMVIRTRGVSSTGRDCYLYMPIKGEQSATQVVPTIGG
jgi:hypothetical protein